MTRTTAQAAPRDPIAWEATLPIRPSSPAWRATIKAVYGSPLTADERALFLELSGGIEPPEGGALEFMATVGRRGGKSEAIARVAVFELLHGGHEIALAPGQVGLFAVICALREQGDQVMNYARGLCGLRAVKRHVAKILADEIQFKNGLTLKVFTCDAVAVSGPTLIGVIRDEWAKWPGDESAMPDREVENSFRPALAPVAGAPPRRLFGITSAYLQEGNAYDTECACFGVAGAPVLVVRGNTETFNPAIDRTWLAREFKRVGARVGAREFGGPNGPEWQPTITEGWFGDGPIAKCTDPGRESSGPQDGFLYVVAVDAAFKADRAAATVAHGEPFEWDCRGIRPKVAPAPIVRVDYVRAWKAPKGGAISVESWVADVVAICQRYRTTRVFADQFAAEPLKAIFRRHGITLIERTWTGASKPVKFRACRDAMVDGLVRLPDHAELLHEFANIQGRLLRSGGETIEAHRGHDDLVSSTVMAIAEAQVGASRLSDDDLRIFTTGDTRGWVRDGYGRRDSMRAALTDHDD